MKGTLEKRKHEKKESRNGRMEEEKVERVKKSINGGEHKPMKKNFLCVINEQRMKFIVFTNLI